MSQELRDPPTGKRVEAGGVTAATWQWYSEMDAALQGQHSISPPLVVASSLTATTGGSVSTPASTPAQGPTRDRQPGRKRAREESAMMEFLREQAERDEERERRAMEREEERERGAAERAERFLFLFEKLVNK